ncbi:MAG: DUF4390 domain-containing protein [Gammaproteobacteria bacterium]|nr:MAG: DUF4390 domain-containing protein [Gammaproteobacteria bacterium]
MPFCRQCLLLLLGGLLAGAAVPAVADEAPATRIEIHNPHSRLVDGVWQVDADIDIELHDPLLEALHSGVALTFVIEFEVLRPRRLWFDETVAELEQRYRVSYHALSRQYLLINLNTREVLTFYGLRALLDRLGRVRQFPVIDNRLLEPETHYDVAMRMRLDADELPLPLRLRAWTSSDWGPSSDWARWPLR